MNGDDVIKEQITPPECEHKSAHVSMLKVNIMENKRSMVWSSVNKSLKFASEAARAAVMISNAESNAPHNYELRDVARRVCTHAMVALQSTSIASKALTKDYEVALEIADAGAKVAEKAANNAWTACENALSSSVFIAAIDKTQATTD